MRRHTSEPDHPSVTVSSTYADLVEHREAVVEALLRLGFFPIGIEFDSAKADQDVIDSSLAMVEKAQAYIGLISHRYGGVPEDAARNPEQLSITELEYRAALGRGIPVYMFLMSDDHPVKRADVEAVEAYQAKLKRLRQDAQARSITAEFSPVGQLQARVLQSMAELKQQLAEAARAAETRQDSSLRAETYQAKPSSRIFISYRRDDSAGHAGRLYDRLSTHFGEAQIFMDIDNIEFGMDFVEVIETAISSCKIVLVVIGKH
jgi:hypothetical protein